MQCGVKVSTVNGQPLLCNHKTGHEGLHAHIFPFVQIPSSPTEMTSLREIKAKLDALLDGQDKLLQSHAALEKALQTQQEARGANKLAEPDPAVAKHVKSRAVVRKKKRQV